MLDPSAGSCAQNRDEVTVQAHVEGAKTLLDVALRLDVLASWLRKLHALGWSMPAAMRDGVGALVAGDPCDCEACR